jgi:rRNA processing protein Gar1
MRRVFLLIGSEMGTFMHATEGEMVCESINAKIPFFNAPIYLENKVRRCLLQS